MGHQLDKPTVRTDWANLGGALKTATGSNRWDLGWQTLPGNLPTELGERPNLNQQNYWQNSVHLWLNYFETIVDNSLIPSHATRFISRITHADILPAGVNVANDTFEKTAHGWETGDRVVFTSTLTAPAPLTSGFGYFIIRTDDNNFQFALTGVDALAGTQIDLTTQGTGVFTMASSGSFYLSVSDRYQFYVVDVSVGDTFVYIPSALGFTSNENSKVFHVVRRDSTDHRLSVVAAAYNFFGPTGKASSELRGYGDNVALQGSTTSVGTDADTNVYWNWVILSEVVKQKDFLRYIEDYSTLILTSDVSVAGDNFQTTDTRIRTGDKVQLTTGGTLPTGLSLGTDYWVIRLTTSLYQLATSLSNALELDAIDITTQGTGNLTFVSQSDWFMGQGDGFTTYEVETSTQTHTMNLPTINLSNPSHTLKVLKVGSSGVINIVSEGSDTINGVSQISLLSDKAVATMVGADDNWISDFEQLKIVMTNSGSANINGNLYLSADRGVITILSDNFTHDNSGQFNSATGLVPTRFQPLATTLIPGNIYAMNTTRIQKVQVGNSGALSFLYLTWAGVTSPTTFGAQFTVTYNRMAV